jgi:hypothetical protein
MLLPAAQPLFSFLHINYNVAGSFSLRYFFSGAYIRPALKV